MMRALAAALLCRAALALDDGLARLPPMGWRSWNAFGLNITQGIMEAVMAALVDRSRGGVSLADLGYTDVGLDDGWEQCQASGGYHSNATGAPLVDTAKFPALGAMVLRAHALNLTAGWYLNCCGCKASLLSDCRDIQRCYAADVAALRALDFDSVKLDDCGAQADISMWQTLLQLSGGKRMLIENCKNGVWFPFQIPFPWKSGVDAVWCPMHVYRTSTDIDVDYGVIMGKNLQSTLQFTAAPANLSFPGCWAYGDMLEVGVPAKPGAGPNLTFAEARAHFGAWCVVSSPLVLGLDLTDAAAVDAAWPIIANAEAIAVSQSYAGGAGTRVARGAANVTWKPCGSWSACSAGTWEVWAKALPGGGAAVLVLNHGATELPPTVVDLAAVPGLACGGGTGGAGGPSAAGPLPCAVRDVWAHADRADAAGGALPVPALPSHDSAFLVLSPRR